MSKQESNLPSPASTEAAGQTTGKGHPTPKRKEREKANQRPLVPNDRKEARAKEREEREHVRQRMLAGDQRYLMQRDKGPQRAYVRDYVDARTTISEFLIPVMVLVLIASMVQNVYAIALSVVVMYAYVALIAVELIILGFQVKGKVDKKFGRDKREKGLALYAAMRAIQFRRFRAPKPQNRRGEYPA